MILLKSIAPFAQGGNRLCFVHPQNKDLCIKVRRPDFSLADLRRKKGFPRNLKPLSAFDDNLEEYKVVHALEKNCGPSIYKHIYRCHEFVDTDLGLGLVTELIRDGDGRVSVSLKQYLWEQGYPSVCQQAVETLTDFWLAQVVPSREILTHNIVVQRDNSGNISRLVVVDGLGSATLIPFKWMPSILQKRKIKAKIYRLNGRITDFLANCEKGRAPSHVGILMHRDENVKKDFIVE
ncbi:PhoP regulatory network protein YrbL [Desulfuromusa kysingii]|uniref:PhoP regulatory network protein YrbL n=1 Tax=Desulfuromusa kysingii TaxID=37625 RepID=A0A1H3YFX5_9BACT|nr:YrbL family protein [Desulfuromusa kysingii]SEA10499.1 PhoP regulatory network protein YrbL [Desulfuromusa kysingii]